MNNVHQFFAISDNPVYVYYLLSTPNRMMNIHNLTLLLIILPQYYSGIVRCLLPRTLEIEFGPSTRDSVLFMSSPVTSKQAFVLEFGPVSGNLAQYVASLGIEVDRIPVQCLSCPDEMERTTYAIAYLSALLHYRDNNSRVSITEKDLNVAFSDPLISQVNRKHFGAEEDFFKMLKPTTIIKLAGRIIGEDPKSWLSYQVDGLEAFIKQLNDTAQSLRPMYRFIIARTRKDGPLVLVGIRI